MMRITVTGTGHVYEFFLLSSLWTFLLLFLLLLLLLVLLLFLLLLLLLLFSFPSYDFQIVGFSSEALSKGTEFAVRQRLFLPESVSSADSVTVLVQPPSAIVRINICEHVKNPKHWQPYHCWYTRNYYLH